MVHPTQITAERVLQELFPLLSWLKRGWVEACQARGLSVNHFHVISLLEGQGALPMSRLADLLGVSLPNATGIVSRMEERGVVHRVHDSGDRRVVLVDLTDAGRDFFREMSAERQSRVQRLVASLSEVEREQLLDTLRLVREAAARLADDGDERATPAAPPTTA